MAGVGYMFMCLLIWTRGRRGRSDGERERAMKCRETELIRKKEGCENKARMRRRRKMFFCCQGSLVGLTVKKKKKSDDKQQAVSAGTLKCRLLMTRVLSDACVPG